MNLNQWKELINNNEQLNSLTVRQLYADWQADRTELEAQLKLLKEHIRDYFMFEQYEDDEADATEMKSHHRHEIEVLINEY